MDLCIGLCGFGTHSLLASHIRECCCRPTLGTTPDFAFHSPLCTVTTLAFRVLFSFHPSAKVVYITDICTNLQTARECTARSFPFPMHEACKRRGLQQRIERTATTAELSSSNRLPVATTMRVFPAQEDIRTMIQSTSLPSISTSELPRISFFLERISSF